MSDVIDMVCSRSGSQKISEAMLSKCVEILDTIALLGSVLITGMFTSWWSAQIDQKSVLSYK